MWGVGVEGVGGLRVGALYNCTCIHHNNICADSVLAVKMMYIAKCVCVD